MTTQDASFDEWFFSHSIFQQEFREALTCLTRRVSCPAQRDDIGQDALFTMLKHVRETEPAHLLDTCDRSCPRALFNFCYRHVRWALLTWKRRPQPLSGGDILTSIASRIGVEAVEFDTTWELVVVTTLEAFPTEDMRIVVLDDLSGVSARKTAELLGLSLSRIYLMRHRGRKQLEAAIHEWLSLRRPII